MTTERDDLTKLTNLDDEQLYVLQCEGVQPAARIAESLLTWRREEKQKRIAAEAEERREAMRLQYQIELAKIEQQKCNISRES